MHFNINKGKIASEIQKKNLENNDLSKNEKNDIYKKLT